MADSRLNRYQPFPKKILGYRVNYYHVATTARRRLHTVHRKITKSVFSAPGAGDEVHCRTESYGEVLQESFLES
jgi:hypothetical protein